MTMGRMPTMGNMMAMGRMPSTGILREVLVPLLPVVERSPHAFRLERSNTCLVDFSHDLHEWIVACKPLPDP